MITLKYCPICDSNHISQYYQSGTFPRVIHEIMPGVKFNAAIITHYSVCQNCNVIFQNPRLSNTELDKYYSQGYYRRSLNETVKQMDKGEVYRAKVDSEIIKQHIGKITSHLDIGSSRGYLLGAVGASSKAGVEPNVGYIKVKGVEVYPEMNQVPLKSFELVTAIHVLEHVSKPLEYLKSMVKLTARSGYLVVEVPTWKSPGGPLRLAHLYHFEPDVLRLMCKQVGLDVIDVEFTPHLMLICKLNDN